MVRRMSYKAVGLTFHSFSFSNPLILCFSIWLLSIKKSANSRLREWMRIRSSSEDDPTSPRKMGMKLPCQATTFDYYLNEIDFALWINGEFPWLYGKKERLQTGGLKGGWMSSKLTKEREIHSSWPSFLLSLARVRLLILCDSAFLLSSAEAWNSFSASGLIWNSLVAAEFSS